MNSEKLPKYPESFWHKTSHVNEYPKLDKD